MSGFLRGIADASWFHTFIMIVIVLAGALVGFETDPEIVKEYGGLLHGLDIAVLCVFIAEIAIKIGAEGSKPYRYFLDPWNGFDFVIVTLCLLPMEGQAITVLRLFRLLRVLKLLHALPRLQIMVSALLKSVSSLFYVAILLGLLFYVYGVAGVFMFAANDPVHFADLLTTFLTLFAVVTLEGWVDLMYIAMEGCAGWDYPDPSQCLNSSAQPAFAVLYFVSFVLVGTMIVLNLFIGVILSGMEEAQVERVQARLEKAEGGNVRAAVEAELDDLNQKLGEIQTRMAGVKNALIGER